MATNWPPVNPYPSWPPEELHTEWLSFSSIAVAIEFFTEFGFVKANPTAQENQLYFSQVKCDEGHPCAGIMIVSPEGRRYPFAYCTGATHKCVLVLWIVGYNEQGIPSYDLGYNSGDIPV